MRSPAARSPRRSRALGSLLILATTVGCYRSSGTPPLEGSAGPPAGPAPRLSVEESIFETSRLPAVTADGAAVLLGIQDHDGARGFLNYRFELRDRGGAKLAEHVVLTTEEAYAMDESSGEVPLLQRRIADANRWLEQQHAQRRFTPLTPLEVEPGEEIASSFRATGPGGVLLEWRQNRLKLTQAQRPLLDRATPETWLAQDRERPGGHGACHNPAFLSQAAVSLSHKLALVVVGFGGTDTCWEPEPGYHVVAW
jgi:hypothetical protein